MITPETAKKINELSAELVQVNRIISTLGEIALGTDVSKDLVTYLCVKQERYTAAVPMGEEGLPPFMVPPNVAINPYQAAQYVREIVEADKARVMAGEVPPTRKLIQHVDVALSQDILFKVLEVIQKGQTARRAEIITELQNLLTHSNGI